MHFKIAIGAIMVSGALLSAAGAGELKVLSAGVMKEVIVALIPQYERQTGNKVLLDVAPAGTLSKRIEGGEAFDVAVITRPVIDALIGKEKIRPGTTANLAGVGIGVAVKDGASRPDISTPDAFKRTILNAKSIAHTDPAAGATSGIYLVRLFEKMGIADQVKQKSTLVPGGSSALLVARGEVELAVQQTSEILNVPGTIYVGPLPAEIQNITIYSAGVGIDARDGEASKAFVSLLAGPEAARLLKPHGLEPVAP